MNHLKHFFMRNLVKLFLTFLSQSHVFSVDKELNSSFTLNAFSYTLHNCFIKYWNVNLNNFKFLKLWFNHVLLDRFYTRLHLVLFFIDKNQVVAFLSKKTAKSNSSFVSDSIDHCIILFLLIWQIMLKELILISYFLNPFPQHWKAELC